MEKYLLSRVPVIITDGMKDWDMSRFQPESLEKEFGYFEVQVYDDLFDLQNVDTLKNYLAKNFKKDKDGELSKEYTRWYTKLKEVDFYWSDDVFVQLENAWSHPYFLPTDPLAVPFRRDMSPVKITESRFPYKGLFLSGQGARTRLHKDPFNSNAVLCQFQGQKGFVLYAPDQEDYVFNGKEFVNILDPDLEKFPDFPKAKASYEDTLSPGEVILFPANWFHDVTSKSDSISVTCNFVHKEELPGLYRHLDNNPEDDQLEILKFFIRDHVKPTATAQEIKTFCENAFNEEFDVIDI